MASDQVEMYQTLWLQYRQCALDNQDQAFTFADALIEIAVRNGPRRTPNHKYDWDPVAYFNEHADEDMEGCIGYDCAADYVTAARALGIL